MAGRLPDFARFMKKQFLLLALGAVAIGCGSDVTSVASVSPDPESCSKGSISVGDVKTGALTAASCVRYDFAYTEDSTPYDGYTFKAEKGKGYMFMLESADDTTQWDALLELATVDPSTGKEQLLAISDDEGNHGFPRMYFIDPVSGTFYLRAGAYSTGDYSSYKLTAKSCDSPIPEITGPLTASVQTLSASDCVLGSPEFVDDSTHVKLFSVNIGPNETKTVTVTSTDFPPGFQIYGPAWGVPCYYSYEGCGGGVANVGPSDTQLLTITGEGDETCLGVGSVHGCQFLNFPGQYTIAVGSFFEATGSFTISVTEGAPPAQDGPPPRVVGPDAPSRNPTLNFLRKKPLQANQYLDRAH
jgi:hypothetical protein